MSENPSPKGQLVPFCPKPDRLMKTIRRLAGEGKISYLSHSSLERMPERGFDVFDVGNVLKLGEPVGPIEAGQRAGEWKVKVVGYLDGTRRKMGVVTIVVREERLLIKTTEWEDR